MSGGTPADVVVAKLSDLLGPAGAQSALNTFCKRTVGVKPEALTRAQMPLVLPALKPFLSILVGAAKAEAVVNALLEEFR